MKLGSLFSGYGGLDEGVRAVLGGETAWVSDIDKGACKILAHRYPDVPNLGDISTVDWSQVEPVDVITGGFPCQDVSSAGKRLGMRPDTRSGLWTQMAYAIDQLRPSLVIAENVRGLLSAEAHSDVEPCPWCLGDGRGPDLRALGAVLGDLADLGYDASWYGLRAADVGAPHGRFRVFVVAYPAGSGWTARGDRSWSATGAAREIARGRNLDLGMVNALLPTPTTQDAAGSRNSTAYRSNGGEGINIGDTLTDWAWKHDGHNDPRMPVNEPMQDWGIYADAIVRWESLTRPAPAPTQPSKKGTPQLSPAFSEWMMGLPAGWVTDVPGLTRNEMLKALGNGVVPQQAEAALRFLLTTMAVAE